MGRSRAVRSGFRGLEISATPETDKAETKSADYEAQRRARNAAAYNTAVDYGKKIAAEWPAASPYVAAGLLIFQGAIKLSDWVSGLDNSPEAKARVHRAIKRYADLGIIPIAFDGYDEHAGPIDSAGYAALIERGLEAIDALRPDLRASVEEFGRLVIKHGARPEVFTHLDWLADKQGMLAGSLSKTPDMDISRNDKGPLVKALAGVVAAEYGGADTLSAAWPAWVRALDEALAMDYGGVLGGRPEPAHAYALAHAARAAIDAARASYVPGGGYAVIAPVHAFGDDVITPASFVSAVGSAMESRLSDDEARSATAADSGGSTTGGGSTALVLLGVAAVLGLGGALLYPHLTRKARRKGR